MPPVPLPVPRWPSADEARDALLFQPIQVGPLHVARRTWIPAMVPWRAAVDGEVTERNLAWYARFAAGRPGVLVAEATGIRDIASGPLLRIGHDRFVPGLRRLTDAVRSAGGGSTRFLVQLIDFLTVRRRPAPDKYFARYWQPNDGHRARAAKVLAMPALLSGDEASLRACMTDATEDVWERVLRARELRDLRFGFRQDINDLEDPEVRDLPKFLPGRFADAAARAVAAGFDGIELHFAHAYTMASLLSRTNVRSDGYGGSAAGRLRSPLEVLRAVRARVGPDVCVGARLLGDDVIEGGSRIEDVREYAVALVEAGLDYVSVSKGGRFEDAKQPRVGHAVYPYTGPSGHECMPTTRIDARGPFGRNLHLAASIREALRDAGSAVPVVAAGGFLHLRSGRGCAARGACRPHCICAAEPRGSRLVRENAHGPGGGHPSVHLHQLL